MVVQRTLSAAGQLRVELLDASGKPVPIVTSFLSHLAARDYSPNTLIAYAHDLQHFWQFLTEQGLDWITFYPCDALSLLEYLRRTPSRRPVQRLALTLVTGTDSRSATYLAPTSINRILATVSSFYEFVILSDQFDRQNPIEKYTDPNLRRIGDRHRLFMDGASRQRPLRRRVSVKTVQRLPRPLSDEQVAALLGALRCRRDLALLRLRLPT